MDYWLLLAADTDGWIFRTVVEWSYLGVFVLLLACGLGFPCPEEVALIGGGYAVYKQDGGWLEVALMVAVAMIGVLVGDVLLWLIGRRVGDHSERVPIIGRHLTKARMKRARRLFRRHGAKAVFFGRFLFGIRAVTFFIAGSMRVPLLTFVVMDMLAALISVPISVVLAWHFGAELELAAAWVKQGGRVILVGVAILAVMVAVRTWRRRHDLAALAEEDADDPDDPDASRDGEPVEVAGPAEPPKL